MSPDDAQSLLDREAAHIERPDERGDPDPGIDCWGLREVRHGLINDVLAELTLATRYAHKFVREVADGSVEHRLASQAIEHCAGAWKIVGNAESTCRKALGARPVRNCALNPPTEAVKLWQKEELLLLNLTHARYRVALAQRALNAVVYRDLRPGRKVGTKSRAWEVLSNYVRGRPTNQCSIQAVCNELKRLSKVSAEERRGEPRVTVRCIRDEIGKEEFHFASGKRSNTHNRRAIEDMLTKIRTAHKSELGALRGTRD